jgi:hypothetical protein
MKTTAVMWLKWPWKKTCYLDGSLIPPASFDYMSSRDPAEQIHCVCLSTEEDSISSNGTNGGKWWLWDVSVRDVDDIYVKQGVFSWSWMGPVDSNSLIIMWWYGRCSPRKTWGCPEIVDVISMWSKCGLLRNSGFLWCGQVRGRENMSQHRSGALKIIWNFE